MDIHKPKPVHSWREFAGEVAIVVLGVMIALGAEQVVEQLHWHAKIGAITEAVKTELTEDDGPQALWVLATRKCRLNQLDAIDAAIARNTGRAALRDLVDRYPLRWMTWDSDAYQLLQSSDVSGHVSSAVFARWAGPYRMVRELERLQQAQRRETASLRALGAGAAPLSAQETLDLRRAVADRRELEQDIDANATYYLSLGLRKAELQAPKLKAQMIVDGDPKLYGDCVEDPEVVEPTAPITDFRTEADISLKSGKTLRPRP